MKQSLVQEYASRIVLSRQDVDDSDSVDYREVDLDRKLGDLGFNGPQVAVAIGTIIARACHPGSEVATHALLQERSGQCK